MTLRLQARLADALASGEFYEAQQLYRTLSFRLTARGQYDEAASLLYNGATALLNEGLHESGGDLACQMVAAQAKSTAEPPSAEFVSRVSALCRLMKPGSPEREMLTAKSIELLKPHQELKQQLHREFGFNYWIERNYSLSQYHFVRSSDAGYHFGRMLVEYSQLGYKSEVDLFLALTVLQLLCLKKLSPASVCFYTYTRHHPSLLRTQAPPYPSNYPLLNFTWLLLMSIRSNWPLSCFQYLCQVYRAPLDRDPICGEYLIKISQLFFGVPAEKTDQSGGFFGSIMRMLATDDAALDAEDAEGSDPGANHNAVSLKADDMD
ncbi:hypothetical protein BOX15_Mlig006902g2 [Macrostomum lignano]|uniref:Uncharacterized protein n=2 Tax=Macrostomum lignano TaxID=282301 RepID=A0A267FJH1_9PLAT|nr:hypothetical protein BOX15_Mlig006902g2 [Macrostomum lignano]